MKDPRHETEAYTEKKDGQPLRRALRSLKENASLLFSGLHLLACILLFPEENE